MHVPTCSVSLRISLDVLLIVPSPPDDTESCSIRRYSSVYYCAVFLGKTSFCEQSLNEETHIIVGCHLPVLGISMAHCFDLVGRRSDQVFQTLIEWHDDCGVACMAEVDSQKLTV